jgi:hypothetical protein
VLFFLAFSSAAVGGVGGGVCALGVLVRWEVLSILIISQLVQDLPPA